LAAAMLVVSPPRQCIRCMETRAEDLFFGLRSKHCKVCRADQAGLCRQCINQEHRHWYQTVLKRNNDKLSQAISAFRRHRHAGLRAKDFDIAVLCHLIDLDIGGEIPIPLSASGIAMCEDGGGLGFAPAALPAAPLLPPPPPLRPAGRRRRRAVPESESQSESSDLIIEVRSTRRRTLVVIVV